MLKLHMLLAVTDHLAATFKNLKKDYISFFKDKQSAFRGEKRTYTPKDDMIDDPSKRGIKLVVTTVDEKLKYFEETAAPYVQAIFDQEATNASGKVSAPLIVDDVNFGVLSSLELLRLKSILEGDDLEQMYANIPVRTDTEVWAVATEENFARSGVYQTTQVTGVAKTTEKENYILDDPNLDRLKDSAGYKPQIGTKTQIVELGNYTSQNFSGEWTHQQRAAVLSRRTKLLTAVIVALKACNEADVVKSAITPQKLFGYLHGN